MTGHSSDSIVEYSVFEERWTLEALTTMSQVNEILFSFGETADDIQALFESKNRVWLGLAFIDLCPVAFKAGFEQEAGTFESWRGGVLPYARRRGIASALMERQHSWCLGQGFKSIRTVTNHDNVPMMNLNSQHGFEQVEHFRNRHGRLKVLQEKLLSP